jgi:transcriptional regulator with XRE-family HTH domain
MTKGIGLRRIRESIGVTQEDVARRTRLTIGTYRRAESGKPVKYSTAEEILRAINNLLAEKGQPKVSLPDLELKLE